MNLKPVDPNAVGYLLDELKNDITRETPASFEPSIDYVVTKNPPFAFEVLAHDHHSASRDSGTDNRAH